MNPITRICHRLRYSVHEISLASVLRQGSQVDRPFPSHSTDSVMQPPMRSVLHVRNFFISSSYVILTSIASFSPFGPMSSLQFARSTQWTDATSARLFRLVGRLRRRLVRTYRMCSRDVRVEMKECRPSIQVRSFRSANGRDFSRNLGFDVRIEINAARNGIKASCFDLEHKLEADLLPRRSLSCILGF